MKVTAMLAAVLQLLTTALATAGAETYDFSYRAGGQPPAPTPCPAGWRGCDGPASIRLWQGDAPDEHAGFPAEAENVRCLTPNVTMKECKDICVSDVKVPTITPFLVPGADSAMIVAPGGGYGFLAIGREGTDIAAWLNEIGVSAFVLKYRVPSRSWMSFGAAPLQDAQRAMGLVRQMIANGTAGYTKLNASKLGFMGFSAGSHLTGHLNVAWQTRTYKKIDAADELSCKPAQSIMVYPWESVTQAPVNATPEMASALNVSADTPPTMIVQAEDDPVHVENALFYYYALKTAGAAPSELHIYPRGGHGYGRCTLNQKAAATFDEVCTWPDRGALFLQTLGAAPKKLEKPDL